MRARRLLCLTITAALWTACGSTVTTTRAAPPPAKKALKGIDGLVERARKTFSIPGLAVAVVKDGKVVHAKGYGLRDVAAKKPVTERTLFGIGSITKSFTAGLVGVFVDEGKLAWDKPVRTWLPAFKLNDVVASEQATLMDLLSHRTGLPRHDMVWYLGGHAGEELLRRLQYLEPSAGFREAWQYNNLMYLVTGYVLERVGGKPWPKLMRERLLDPLGMKRSNLSVTELPASDDYALAYGMKKGGPALLPYKNIDHVAPAGAINSSVEEMAQWLIALMEKGKVGGEQVLSAASVKALQTPLMVAGADPTHPEIVADMYALGLGVSAYRGTRVVGHGGGIDGFISYMAFAPRERVGVVVLSNLSGKNPAPTLLARHLLDRLLGFSAIDWIGEARKKLDKAEEAAGKLAAATKPAGEVKPPSQPLKEFVGSYENPGYGTIRIVLGAAGEQLSIHFGKEQRALEHFQRDVFLVPVDEDDPKPGLKLKISFFTSPLGSIDRASLPLQPGVDDIEFRRTADAQQQDPEFLKKLVGEYEIAGKVLVVALAAQGHLTFAHKGKPGTKLVPLSGTRFGFEGVKGFAVEFTVTSDGKVPHMTIHQPNGAFRAKRVK